ncbi:MAG TPA: formylglycine-generating enzyme family protein [Gammaproteobacteria bacterium]|nr:formylglycine-generating enzyme family protein [Gammaproteobacteria bacterium]
MCMLCRGINILVFGVLLLLTGCSTDTDIAKTIQDQLKNGEMAPVLIVIPPGTNNLGDISGAGLNSERPTYKVSISSSFAIGKYEVTFREYDHFCDLTGRVKPNDEGWGRGLRPVIDVTWDDAQAYVQWLSKNTGQEYYLPSESQWEYATRAGTKTNYWWGDQPGDKLAQCVNCAAINRCDTCTDIPLIDDGTVEVGSFQPNPFGLYDVHGNVMEWTADCNNKYNSKTPGDGAPRLSGDCDRHIMKDGSWWNNVRFIRASVRGSAVDGSDYKSQHVGFRVARRIK